MTQRHGNAETPIMFAVRAELAGAPSTLVWRNNTGFDARTRVRYGLGLGGADLVGLIAGRFFGVEVKTPNGRASTDQQQWLSAVRAAGGFATIARSAGSALAALDRARACRCPSCGNVIVPIWVHDQ